MKKILVAPVVLAAFLFAAPSAFAEETANPEGTFTISENEEFGAVVVDVSVEDFEALGFELGDSCDVVFSNGEKLEGIPYYNGYYTKTLEPLIVAYPGYESPRIAFNNGDPLWEVEGCKDGDTVTITLVEHGAFGDVQEAMNTVYTDDRADYDSDEEFANFRAMKGGSIKEDYVFRGCSPVDSQYNRAETVDALLEKAGVKFILDLADTDEKLQNYLETDDKISEYVRSLVENGDDYPIGLASAYRSEKYMTALADGLKEMCSHEGPYYIHCTEGKDRTGFVGILLEMLCGASKEEVLADYMETYKNYYGIDEDSDLFKAVVSVKFDDIYDWLSEKTPEGYLKEAGMTEEEIEALVGALS